MNTTIDSMRGALDICATPGAPAMPHGQDGEQVFAEPWQAEVFASTVALSQKGVFSWKQWVAVFSSEIAARPQHAGESATQAYFRQWLAALETMLAVRGITTADAIAQTQEHWRRSYINTRHGSPVEFSRAWAAPDARTERWLAEHSHGHALSHDHDHDHAGQMPQGRPIAVSPPRGAA